MRSSLFSVLAIGLLALSLLACSERSPGTAGPATGDLIRRGNIEDPPTLDPVLAEDIHTFNILIDLYEGVVAENAKGDLIPGVAQSWSVSDDGLSYVFKLRTDARWSNGDPVTAEDFVRGLRRAAAPTTLSSYALLLEPIANFAKVKSGELPIDELGVVATSQDTLVIRLNNPSAYFLSVLAMPVAFPLHGDGSESAQFEEPAHFVGNGAYILQHRRPGQPIKLKRNSQYWDAAAVKTEFIEYVAIVDDVAEFNMYRAGELDITGGLPPSHIDQARRSFADEVRIAPSLALYYLAFDLTQPPLDDRRLRKALSMAIDRKQLVALLGRGEQAAFGIVPPGVANYEGAQYLWRNDADEARLKLARELYTSAGYSEENPLHLSFVYDSGGIHEKVALIVRSMWQDTLGVRVELDKREWKYFLETRDNRDEWQVMRFSWFGDYNDASTFLGIFRSESAQNLPRYESANYDQLMNAAAESTDGGLRSSLLAQAEASLIDDHPIAPLYFYVSKHMVKPDILGYEDNVLDRHPSKYLYRERK